MSRPDDIPEDVWAAAQAAQGAALATCRTEGLAVADYPFASGRAKEVLDEHIARAILAERERCAKVAEGIEQTRNWVPGSLYDTMRREVATAIRRGQP